MSDGIHSDYVINSVQKLLPNAKKIALVYNPSEANSAASVLQLRESIQKSGLSSLCCGVTSEVDCLHVARSACQQADVIVVPQDNTVASALPQVAKEALRAKKPLIICYKTQLMSGVFAALGASYEEIGRQTANMVLEIVLSKKSPEQLSVQMAPASSIKIHRSTAELLGIIIPQELQPTIEWEDSL
jgi:putative ABC transport system substrate-binding protein